MDSPHPSPKWADLRQTDSLDRGHVHVWYACVDECAANLDGYEALLSEQERHRSIKFHFQRDQQRFVLYRGVLRKLLGQYLSIPAKTVEISLSTTGKPMVAAPLNEKDVRFNISHSHGLGVFAFSIGKEIGIDAELIRHDIGWQEIADRYFSEQERKELRRLEGIERTKAFFRCWTRKEAYLKARGDGFAKPLDSFSVSLLPELPARLFSADADRWSLFSIEVPNEWAGALAVEGNPAHILAGRYTLGAA